jgi:diguanylate cyclase (GGDEF)-like protein
MVIASTDGLTSCLNRVAFTTLVDAYLERVDRQERRREGALLLMDVDHFKNVNDSFGHDAGDEALRLIAHSVRSTLREVDLLGRMGGEEFSVFLPDIPPDRTFVVAERIREAVRSTDFRPQGASYNLSISIGAVSYGRATTFSELYNKPIKSFTRRRVKGGIASLCQLQTGMKLAAAQ